MQEQAQASMVSEADLHGGLSTTISRTSVEEALRLEEPPELVLDVTGPTGERSIAVSWKRDDLERLLREATGDSIHLTFDRAALEQAFAVDDDVEAHGLKHKAAILAVAVAAAAGVAGGASAMPMTSGGGAPPVGQADPTDGGIVDPATGMRLVNEQPATGGGSVFSDIAPGAAAIGGAAVVAIAGAAFAFGSGGQRRRPAAT